MTVSARHYARLGAVQYLYSWNFQKESLNSSDDQCLIDAEVLLHGDLEYFQKLLKSIPDRIPEIDSILSGAMHRKIDFIDPVELAILRLGVYELIAEPEVPPKVITNECIELSKEFGNLGSYKFINGTLDKLAFRGDSSSKIQNLNSESSKREFDLISTYFTKSSPNSGNVVTGVGDDSAIVQVPADKQLVISTDTLSENVHFPKNTAPEKIGYKCLAVSLSDLAAMGAQPAFATLNLSIPKFDDHWLEKFSAGFYELADQFQVSLIGGDTVRGPLSISVTVYGLITAGECIMRSGAKVGDGIYVTGTLGDAALGLLCTRGGVETPRAEAQYLIERLDRPLPRVNAGSVLRNYATSAIDISDGLIADLTHILEASDVGAEIELESVPISKAYKNLLPTVGWDYALSYGDDYELCFTLPQEHEIEPNNLLKDAGVQFTRIGTVQEQPGLVVRNSSQEHYPIEKTGYSHF